MIIYIQAIEKIEASLNIVEMRGKKKKEETKQILPAPNIIDTNLTFNK